MRDLFFSFVQQRCAQDVRDIVFRDGLRLASAISVVRSTSTLLTVETVRRERRWTTAGATPARELVRSTR